MPIMAQQILMVGGMSFLAFAVLGGLWVHVDSQRSATKTAGRYVMQLHLFCLLFGILLLSLSNVVPMTTYSDSTKRLIANSLILGGACFAVRCFILAIARNPNVYQRPNRLASTLGSIFAVLVGISIFAIFIGIVLAAFSQGTP
ncbi:MAG: hypothetical protein HY203_09665 [Nitrospirae bacterium]|nr:hypothetical protein [Nitrospirota bacterium]